MKVKLLKVRIAFPELFAAKAFNEGDPSFSATFIIDPKSANVKVLRDTIQAVAVEKWKAAAPKILAALKAKDNVCLRETGKTSEAGEIYGGFEDMFWIPTRNKARPTVLDRDKSPLTAADGRPYGGCYVNAVLDIWAQDNTFGKRINASLSGVQFVADGEAFSGGTAASADEFDDLGDGADAEDMV